MTWKLSSISFDQLKNGQDADISAYSHEIYDIKSRRQKQIAALRICTSAEWINVFQNPLKMSLPHITDFFDFSIYADALQRISRKPLDRLLKC